MFDWNCKIKSIHIPTATALKTQNSKIVKKKSRKEAIG